jgi:copper resistance protein C
VKLNNRNVVVAAHLGALSVLVVASLVSSPRASAHSWILATIPDQNSVVPAAPTQVYTSWNEHVTNVVMTVTGPDQAQWSTGSPQGSGAQYTEAIRPDGPPGVYTVNWKVISDDGDPVSGTWTYTVKPS